MVEAALRLFGHVLIGEQPAHIGGQLGGAG
jgi:hypothetical protein